MTNRSCLPLSARTRRRLDRALRRQRLSEVAASRQMGLSRMTLRRALQGLPVTATTEAVITAHLETAAPTP